MKSAFKEFFFNKSCIICFLALLGLHPGFGETQGSRWEICYKNADSLLEQLLTRQETRRKEIAPAESLFRETLLKHPEVYFLIRTNSKGIIVNTVSRGSMEVNPGKDVSNDKWYSVPQKTMKTYHSPAMQVRGKNKNSLICSKPIIVKNSLGIDRFGGALAMHIYFIDTEASVSSSKKEKTVSQPIVPVDTAQLPQNDTKIAQPLLPADTAQFTKKEKTVSQLPSSLDTVQSQANARIDPNPGKADLNRPIEQGTDVSSTKKAPKGMLLIFLISCITVIIAGFLFIVSIRWKKQARRPVREFAPSADTTMPHTPDWSVQTQERSFAMEISRAIEQRQAEGNAPLIHEEPFHALNIAVARDETIAITGPMPTQGGLTSVAPNEVPSMKVVVAHEIADPVIETPKAPANDINEDKERLKDEIRAELAAEMKKEIVEKEINVIRNAVIAELKSDIRQKLEKNEAESIRAHLQEELSSVWRREIEENFRETFYKQELESLRKIVREKLIEKEMPLLVKSHRIELSKEIRQKMSASFYDQIERHERNVMKADIIKKLQTNDYPQLFQEEREKLRASLERQIVEKETETMTSQFREELANRLRTQILTEEEAIRNRLRSEITDRVEREVKDREYEKMVAEGRENLKERVRREIEGKELKSIHDNLVAQITEEERTRIMGEELPQIIESERNRIGEQESPALREQVRAQLAEQELEAMHARVKNEIYSETTQTIREACDREYKDLLDKKMAEFSDMTQIKLHSEMKKNLVTEYQALTEDLERLSGSISDVEALDSLSKTIMLLSDEKKKYKYFNLNSSQTESLLEYLKRVQSRFNIFLDKIDQALREIELKVNNVMNKFDHGE